MRRSFTLLELLIVLAIMTMITAVAAVRMKGPYQLARLRDAVRRCELIDGQARAHTRAFGGSCEIVFSIRQRRIYARRQGDDGMRYLDFSLPGALSLTRVLTPYEDVAAGTARIDVSPRGASPSYALCLATAGGVRQWILFCGLTGRVAYPQDESHVREVFALLRAPGPDAH